MEHPCEMITTQHVYMAIVNMVQVVLLAWLGVRRYAADQREKNGKRDKLDQAMIDGQKRD